VLSRSSWMEGGGRRDPTSFTTWTFAVKNTRSGHGPSSGIPLSATYLREKRGGHRAPSFDVARGRKTGTFRKEVEGPRRPI